MSKIVTATRSILLHRFLSAVRMSEGFHDMQPCLGLLAVEKKLAKAWLPKHDFVHSMFPYLVACR